MTAIHVSTVNWWGERNQVSQCWSGNLQISKGKRLEWSQANGLELETRVTNSRLASYRQDGYIQKYSWSVYIIDMFIQGSVCTHSARWEGLRKDTLVATSTPSTPILVSPFCSKKNKALWKNGRFQDCEGRAYRKMSLLHHAAPKGKKVLEKQKETRIDGLTSKRPEID